MTLRLTAAPRRASLWSLLVLFSGTPAAAQGAGAGMDLNDPMMRVPIAHWGCTNCHVPGEEQRALIGQRPGPELSTVGERLSAEWMRRWIARPAALRGAPTMPRLFDDSADDQRDLDALIHFLASQGSPAGGSLASEQPVLARGRELYHTTGCVACHGALESPAVVFGDEFLAQAVPEVFVLHSFGQFGGKWYPTALSAFLRAPGEVHRDGRMPRMDLDEAEADSIATYLLQHFGAAEGVHAVDAELTRRGEQVFVERGCQACHVIEGYEFPVFRAESLSVIASRSHQDPRGCLSSREWDGPRYDFPAPPLARMFQGVLMAATVASVADPELDQLARRVYNLNCTACHEIDGVGGVPEALQVYFTSLDDHADLGDEGRFPPHLNDVGAKLTTTWFEEVLQRSGRARPYVAARMPQYGSAVAGFAELFAKKAGVEPHSDAVWPPIDDAALLLGRELMGPQAMNCVSCHSFQDFPPVGTPGPDMTHFAERLRYAWWNEYIRDPAAKKPGTRMPGFMNEGESSFRDFADGDIQKQTDAMWAYFSLGEFMPPPEGVGRRRSLDLEVGDAPRIFRTFLENAGSRGIAVGFPVGIHYAYDAQGVRLMQVWRGKFLDASGAWAGRGGNVSGGQGPSLWQHPGGPAFVVGAKPEAWPAEVGAEAGFDFKGYRKGGDGGPVFQYTLGELQVYEQAIPHAEPLTYLERRFVFDGTEQGVPIWFRPGGELRGVTVEGAADHGPEPGPNDETWYRVTPKGASCAVILEVKL